MSEVSGNFRSASLEKRGHIVQFYKDERYLIGSLSEYARQGLERGEAVVILCTQAHWDALLKDLDPSFPFIASALSTLQLRHVDAHEALKRVLGVQNQPDSARFREVLYPIYNEAHARYSRVRFYGELVDILSAEGRHADAAALEEFWNEFLRRNPESTLLCGYCTKNVPTMHEHHRICEGHSHTMAEELLPTETAHGLPPQAVDELYRKIALLELKVATQGVERDDAARELSQAQSQLLQMGKLSLMSEVCGGLAHEINNPLAIVTVLLTRLRQSLGPEIPAEAEKCLSRLDQATDRMAKIVRNVLRFARQEPIRRELFSVQGSVKSSVELAQDLLQSSQIAVKMNLPKEELLCIGDEVILSQVISNLISNARDAILARKEVSGLIDILAQKTQSGQIEILVSDNGVGMNPQTRERIFHPFFSTKRSTGQGTGLGLSISLAAVKEHGGEIRCYSVENEGTRFSILLPQAPAAQR